MTGSEPVRDPVPVVMASEGKINLRVYDGARLEVELPLSRARALLLAHDLIGALLSPDQGGDDLSLGQDRFEERIARVLTHTGPNS